jgi:hypothetical protein
LNGGVFLSGLNILEDELAKNHQIDGTAKSFPALDGTWMANHEE